MFLNSFSGHEILIFYIFFIVRQQSIWKSKYNNCCQMVKKITKKVYSFSAFYIVPISLSYFFFFLKKTTHLIMHKNLYKFKDKPTKILKK